MRLGYDNTEDARSKLMSTYVLYAGSAMSVIAVNALDAKQTSFEATAKALRTGRTTTFSLDDPLFDVYHFSLGYMNNSGGPATPWFYRVPIKQYKQGLHHSQVSARHSTGPVGFPPGAYFKSQKGLADMLEGRYPTVREAATQLREQGEGIIAFHRHFALSRDSLRGDFLLEYKGRNVGFTPDLEDFRFPSTHEHLVEHLKFSLQKVA